MRGGALPYLAFLGLTLLVQGAREGAEEYGELSEQHLEQRGGGWTHARNRRSHRASNRQTPRFNVEDASSRSSLVEGAQHRDRQKLLTRHRVHRRAIQDRRHNSAPPKEDAGSSEGEATSNNAEERAKIVEAAAKEPDDCGPLMGTDPEEVQAQVRRCLKQRKRQVQEVQEKLQERAKAERLLADEEDKIKKLQKDIGNVNAMTAAYANDERIVKAALENDEQKVTMRINRLDHDGEDADRESGDD